MKKIIIILITVVSGIHVSAQTQEYSAYLGLGYSPLSYQLKQDASRSGGFGGDVVGLGYTYLFETIERVTESGTVQRMQWGIHSGIGFGFYNARATVSSGKTSSDPQIDDENDRFRLHTTISGYEEKQNTLFLNIPVMAQLHLSDKYYAKAGFKAGIPLIRNYSAKNVIITNEPEYIDIGAPLRDPNNLKFVGFGAFEKSPKGKFDLGFTMMLALEAGMRFRVFSDLTLYAGVYFDYGLNNSLKTTKDTFVAYNITDPENFTINSVLTDYTDKAKIMAVGVTVRVAMPQWW